MENGNVIKSFYHSVSFLMSDVGCRLRTPSAHDLHRYKKYPVGRISLRVTDETHADYPVVKAHSISAGRQFHAGTGIDGHPVQYAYKGVPNFT